MLQIDTDCEKCGETYANVEYGRCVPCQTDNLKKQFANWTSGNEMIDDFIQERQERQQSELFEPNDMVFEWIPYNQLSDFKEINSILYSAIWKDGPLYYCIHKKEYIRKLGNQKVILNSLHNSPDIINEFFNEVKSFFIYDFGDSLAYGMSQNPDTKEYIILSQDDCCEKCGEKYTIIRSKWCESCQIDCLKKNFTNWTSGNGTVDKFIQELQLKSYGYMIVEWIPYNQFDNIKEIRKDDFAIVYLAIWKDGPLYYCPYKKRYIRKLGNKQIALKYLCNSQNITNELLIKGRNCNILPIYGISQNPDTKDYIIVLQDEYCEKCGEEYTDTYNTYNIYNKWCKPCQINDLKKNFTNWTSGNEKIDEFIQEMQLKINEYYDVIVEWIPYNQFNNIKEIGNDGLFTIYSAIWKNGQLSYNKYKKVYKRNLRNQNKEVSLKYFNPQNITDEFFNKYYNGYQIYGISQEPDTKDYIIVIQEIYCEKCSKEFTEAFHKWCKPCQIDDLKKNFTNWTSGDEKIDKFIQEMQLKIENRTDIIVEWIPYNQFDNIKQISKDDFSTIYSAIWKDGQLNYDKYKKRYKINQNKKVSLKCFNSQDEEFFKEINKYSIKYNNNNQIYGISQNPDTKNYIVIIQDKYCEKCGKEYTDIYHKWCKPCQIDDLKKNFTNWISGDEKIDEFIQDKQLEINNYTDNIIEWIPCNQFDNIKEIKNDGLFTIYSAIWKNGLLYYDEYKKGYKRYLKDQNQKVSIKCFNSQSITDEFFNEANKYLIEDYKDNQIYGISQNPDTKNYIVIIRNEYCEKCGKKYMNKWWCKSCQIDDLKKNFTDWTSGNEKIDKFIQEMQLKINSKHDTIFEWIPYDQFGKIKEIGKGGFATVYSAIWKDGPLFNNKNKLKRTNNNQKVALKCLFNSQSITNEFLSEVKAYSIEYDKNILQIYGLSQNPDTKDYIMVLDYANNGNFSYWLSKNYNKTSWSHKLFLLSKIIKGLSNIHLKRMVHRNFHTGNLLLDGHFSLYISDMGLCEEIGSIKDENKIYGVMPYVAPEVLKRKRYTQAADIYSFGMIMYFVATGKQPFSDCAHDEILALNICNGIRPEISDPEAPKCYIELMNKCWDSNPDNRQNAHEVERLIDSFSTSYDGNEEIRKQFEEAEEYRRSKFLSIRNNQSDTHSKAYYTSRLLNPFTKNLQ